MSAEFDTYADEYEQALDQGISLSGEDSEFFARSRIAWLAERLTELGTSARQVLDFGCGTGSATPFLLSLPGNEHVVGTDVSEASLAVARLRFGSPRAHFARTGAAAAHGVDVAYCNGVFHHIPAAERRAALAEVRDALRPGGIFALFENNPWNPGTRLVMRRIPFDRDADPFPAVRARRMVAEAGFDVLRTDHLFIFPSALKRLRPLERRLARAPLGAQYLVLARRPASGGVEDA